jgi:hypothetical protein
MWDTLPTLFNMIFFISVLHPGAPVLYLDSLALLRIFLCLNGYSNWHFCMDTHTPPPCWCHFCSHIFKEIKLYIPKNSSFIPIHPLDSHACIFYYYNTCPLYRIDFTLFEVFFLQIVWCITFSLVFSFSFFSGN